MYQRNIAGSLLEALQDSPAVFLHGARQTGKTTLVRALAGQEHPARYLTLDDAAVLAAAGRDPQGFVAGLKGPAILDEVQRVPEMFLAIKGAVDRDRQPGRFLLTGSANVLLLPHLSGTLVGRAEILPLWPLSQGEIEGVQESFVDRVFSDSRLDWRPKRISKSDLVARIVQGGFPEAVTRTSPSRRGRWFESYVTTLLQRDVRDLSNINGLTGIPRLLSLLAARAGSLLNYSEISRTAGIPQTTLKRYLSLLHASFLIQPLPAFSANLGKRLVKSPKIFLTDSGLLSHVQGLSSERLSGEPHLLGPVLENFVAMELRKQISWSKRRPAMYHFRSQSGEEVDVVLEDSRGRVVGIEVKATESVRTDDFKGLRVLASSLGERFQRGLLIHTGQDVIPFQADIQAVPVGCLWE